MRVDIKLYDIVYDIEESEAFINLDYDTQEEIKEHLEKSREFTITLEGLGDTHMSVLLETIDYSAYIGAITGFSVKSYNVTLYVSS